MLFFGCYICVMYAMMYGMVRPKGGLKIKQFYETFGKNL